MKNAQFAKLVVFVNAAVPLALLAWDTYWHRVGPNPVEFGLRTTGMLALVFLLLSLTVTPLRKLSGWNFFSHFRRMLGLFAFFYAVTHFLIYFAFDRGGSLAGVVADTSKRPFVLAGMAGLLMMVPLAATSTNGMIKRLGANRWKQLHRLAYPAGIAGVLHYWLLVKADTRQPRAFAWVLAFLLLYRLVADRIPSFRKRPVVGARA